MLEAQVRKFYRTLRHDGFYTQMHCQDVENNKLVARELVKGEAQFVAFARKYNGQGNVFCGRNPRLETGAVSHIQVVTFDLDPASYDRKVGSTDAQIRECVAAGESILRHFEGGWVAFSGNGTLVGFVHPGVSESDVATWPALFKRFTEVHVLPLLTSYKGVKLDALFDNERLVKVVGTVSCRGQRRFAKFVRLPSRSNDASGIFSRIKEVGASQPAAKGSLLAEPNSGNLRSVGPASGFLGEIGSLGYGATNIIAEGGRNNYLAKVAGALRRQGVNADTLLENLKVINRKQCVPPLDEEEVEVIARSVARYEPARLTDQYGSHSRPANQLGDHPGGMVDVSVATPSNTLAEYEQILVKRSEHKEPEFPTGFPQLDDKTDGFTRGDLFTVGANTGAGKSTWCVNAADNLLKRGKRVLYLSTELTRYQVYDKIFSLNTGLEYKKFRRGDFTDSERAQKDEFAKRFEQYELIINDLLSPNIEQVRELIKREGPDILFLDHIHQIGSGSSNLYGVLSQFTNDLKDVAKSFKLPVVVAAQFSRPERMMDKETGDMKIARKPTLYDFKACGEIENRSSTALLLYDTKESVDLDVNKMGAEVAKCREGERGFVEIAWKWKVNQMVEVG
jgi:archaellum biogenesis ATPase FlaH